MSSRTCPSDDTLLSFLAGSLSTEDEKQTESHVERCPHCLETMLRLNRPAVGRLEAEVLAEVDSMPKSAGRYRLTGELARGGMGVVYKSIDPLFDRAIAVKMLRPLLSSLPHAKARSKCFAPC